MRYLITTHGCYRKNETVNLRSAKLLVYAFENECIYYENDYVDSFCDKSIHKRKGDYKRKFIATKKYYQMDFGPLPDDKFESYIQCCTTGKQLYHFKNGDLSLSDVLDMIITYNKHFKDSPIYISVLTCNTNCADKDESKEYGERFSLDRPPKRYPASKKNWNVTRNSVTKKRKRDMDIPTSRRILRHKFKPGEIALHPNGTQQIVTEKNQKELKGYYFLPEVKIGNAVLYQNKLWRIQSIQDGQYTLATLLDKLPPFKGLKKTKSESKSNLKSNLKSKSKKFNVMLSRFKSKNKTESAEAEAAQVEIVTVDARETIKMEI